MNQSIESAVPKFNSYLKDKDRSKSTILAYNRDLLQLNKYLKSKSISDIRANDLKKFVDYLNKSDTYSAKTTARKINSIKSFWRYLNSQGYTDINPTKNLDYPKFKSSVPKRLDTVEYQALRSTIKENLRVYTMIELLLQTGLKIGELSRLKLEDVKLDVNPPHIYIEENQSNPARIVELNESIIEAIQHYLENRGNIRNDQGYLFATRSGKNISIRNIRTAINRAFKSAGIKNRTVNDLRNTFICHQLESGMQIRKLAQIVGHKRKISTENYLQITNRKTPGNSTEITPL